jgi:ATP/maltotriose-dependent transcriptional regulator MalT
MAAGIEAREGDAEATRQHLAHAERLLGPDPERRDLGILRTGQSWLAALDGDADGAVAHAREALDVLRTAHGGEQGTATWALARGLTLAGETDHADAAYDRAIDLLSIHGRQHDAASAAGERADALERAGRSEEAAAVRERATALGVTVGGSVAARKK